jgi:hypothetical protein
MVDILILGLRRFLANNLFFWLGDDKVLIFIVNNCWFFYLLWPTISWHCVFWPWIFLFFNITVFIWRLAVFYWRLKEQILIADGHARSFPTSVCSFGLICTQYCWFDADWPGVLFLWHVYSVYVACVTFLCGNLLTFDLWLRLWWVINILSLVYFLAGLIYNSWFIDLNLFSFVGNLCVLVLLSWLNAHWLIPWRHSINLIFLVPFFTLFLIRL